MSLKVHIDSPDLTRLVRAVPGLKARAIRVAVRRGIQAGTTPTLKAFRKAVSQHDGEHSTGTLASSVGRRASTSRRTGKSYAVIGARRGVVAAAEDERGNIVERRPSRYFHLFELGTQHSRPFGLLRAAVDATRDATRTRTIEYMRRNLVSLIKRTFAKQGTAVSDAEAYRVIDD